MSTGVRVFANRYELQEEIGRGATADVYVAHDRLLDRSVAVKVLSPAFASDPVSVERFRREAQAVANLNHPNIVAVYDWGEEDGTSFIVMEYVPGHTLRDLLRQYGRLVPQEAARIGAEIAAALSYAHHHGVVHRDVKPGNVLITPDGVVKVTDFGIARAEHSGDLTKTGSVLGTATYFSPEQAQGLALDGRSDVYALGVVLYEMITGVAPFRADSPVSVAYKHVREDPARPSGIASDVPGAMDRIVLTAMAKDVTARYQSADDLRADLLRFERGRPLVGGPLTISATPFVVPAPVETATAIRHAPATPITSTSPRRRSGGPFAAVAIACILLVALIVVLLSQVDLGSGGSSPTLDVPSAIGLQYGQAEAGLRASGFDVRREDADEPSQPANVVLAQHPEAGIKARKGSTITLKTASSTITMPNVVGKSQEEARAALARVNLAPNFVEQDSDQPPGTVLSTDPAAGAHVNKVAIGRPAVTVNVARIPKIPVPDVANQNAFAALTTLQQAGLEVTTVPTPSDTVPKGNAIGTNPPAGTQVTRGSGVQLLVSTGPAVLKMPNVVGQPKASAEALLNGFFGLGIEEHFVNRGKNNSGIVIAQSPAPGADVPRGSTVSITIGT